MLLYPFEKEFERVVSHIDWGQIVTLHKDYLYVDDIVDGIKDDCKCDCCKPSAIPQNYLMLLSLIRLAGR